MPSLRSLYDVLNVSPEAEPVVIEAAYRALIKKYHPDHAAGGPAPKDAAKINEAYGTLKDPARRAEYDHRLWSKQQAIRLKELQSIPPPPRSRLAAWSGWLVALLLGCAVFVVVKDKRIAPVDSPAAARGPEPATPTQSAARAAAARAAAAEARTDLVVFPNSAEVLARVRSADRPRPAAAAAPVRIDPPARPARVRERAAPAKRRQGQRREDPDFLEREGYIY
jgi:hypothetical protein